MARPCCGGRAEAAEEAQEMVETLLDVYDARFEALGDQIDQVARPPRDLLPRDLPPRDLPT